MYSVALSSLLAHKQRLLSTIIAVAIGVAFLAGTLIFSDTVGRTFDDVFVQVNEGIDVRIRSADVVYTEMGSRRGPVSSDVLSTVNQVDGVSAAVGEITGYAQIVSRDGDPLGGASMATGPTLGLNWIDVPELNQYALVEGRPPSGPEEVVIDRASAYNGQLAVGDRATILLQGPPREFRIVGLVTFGDTDAPVGSTLAFFDDTTAADVLATKEGFDGINVLAREGWSQQDLRLAVSRVLPGGAEAITGDVLTAENQDEIATGLMFFTAFMLILVAVALFVASFIVYNTFSIVVTQRTRELALLRTLGAGRRQIITSVVLEALIVGLLASTLGVVAGIGVSSLLRWLMDAIGFPIPTTGLVFASRTVLISAGVGLGVSVAAAFVPSLRASGTAPLAALRSSSNGEDNVGRARVLGGGAVAVLGVLAAAFGAYGNTDDAESLLAVGIVLVFLAAIVLGPILAQGFGRLLGLSTTRIGGVPGLLAQESVLQDPKRTSVTASALMIGVALVGTITIFAASARTSIEESIDESVIGDLVIESGAGHQGGGLTAEVAIRLGELPEVHGAAGLRQSYVSVGGNDMFISALDPTALASILDIGIVDGGLETIGVASLALHETFAAENDWTIGDTVEIRFPDSGQQDFTVGLLYDRDELAGQAFVSHKAFDANIRQNLDTRIFVAFADGYPFDDARAAVEQIAAEYPNARIQDLDTFKESQRQQIDQLLTVVYALLGLAVVIAIIGIANTLALSILERTREFGLLRAVGMSRRQLRATIAWEGVLISLFGTGLGLSLGLMCGWTLGRALADDGITTLQIPVFQLALIAIVAVFAGIVATTVPARRAARLHILKAIASE